MATTKTQELRVKQLSKFGFMAEGFDKGLYFSKQFKDQAKVVPGAVLQAELYIADSGSTYLNKILSAALADGDSLTAKAIKPSVDTERAEKVVAAVFKPKFQKKEEISSGLSKEEWAQKDVRISRQGCIQAAVHALGPVMTGAELFKEAAKLADQMLEYVNKKA